MGQARSLLVSIMSGVCMLLLVACKTETQEERQSTASYSEQGLGEPGRLSAAEWAAYRVDQQYIHSFTPPGVRTRLNLADPRQYQFAMARLKLAGKTPMNSPYLFNALEQRRQKHLAQGYKTGSLPAQEIESQTTAERREMHVIESAYIIANESTRLYEGTGRVSSTFPGGSYYSYVDTSYTDSSGYPLGDLVWNEQYSGGYDFKTTTTGNLLNRSSLTRYRVSSYKVEDSVSGFTDSYIYTDLGTPTGTEAAEQPVLSDPVIVAPVDVKLNDGLISVCLNRTWTQDCDYDLTGNLWSVKMPLKGSIKIASNHVLDEATINQIKNGLNNNQNVGDVGHVKLVLSNVGGGCDVTDGNTLAARMSQFWNQTTLSADKKTFSWDLTGSNAAFFDDGCRQVQNSARLTVRVVLPLIGVGGTKVRTTFTLSNDPDVLRPRYVFKRITITNSCLAAGTAIELASGKQASIESLKVGDKVFNSYHESLTIKDTAIGVETAPMVRIRDEAGRTLLMTEMHPIQVVDRGMVQARALETGDRVMTKTGPSKLVEVSREQYNGKVYNLKLGSSTEAVARDQTVVYANGFMVGDGQIQSKYEALAMTLKQGDMLATLPERWHRDYLLSIQKK